MPVDTIELMERAMREMSEGRASDAEATCRQVLEHESDNPDAFYLLGVIEHRRGRNDDAQKFISRAIVIEPTAHWYYSALAQVCMALGDPSAAVAALEQTVRLVPTSAEAWNALGGLYLRLGRVKDASDAWRRLTALAPDRPDYFNSLGAALTRLGQTVGAIDAFRAAARLAPGVPDYAVNAALAVLSEGRIDQATQTLRGLVQEHPEHADAHRALAAALEQAGDFDAAVDELERAVLLSPDLGDAHYRLATIRARFGQIDEASRHWSEVVRVDPSNSASASNLLMTLNYDTNATPVEVFDAHRNWAQRFADPLTRRAAPLQNTPDPERRLRIGFVSPDFKNHPISSFMRPLFSSHDRSQFEVVGISDVSVEDHYTELLREQAREWCSTVGMTDEQVAVTVRDRRIDVLVDLSGHTADHRLAVFARKPAPVQVSYLGYCNTTGMTAMDYVIGDDVTDPPGSTQQYSEQVLRLPDGFSCFAPRPDAPEPNDPPVLKRNFITFGAFHTLPKLNDGAIDLWVTLLNAVLGSRLLVWRNTLAGYARDRIRELFTSRGVDPARLDLRSERPEGKTHLGIYHEVDIALDTQPWSGHTTSCESTWMGVPFVTIRGRTHAGRMAASALTFAGADEFIADDEAGYVQIVTRLANDSQRLLELRRTLRQRMADSKLCDATGFTKSWESAIRESWRAWCRAQKS